MAPRLTRRDRALLLATLPLFAAVFGLHVYETARSGLAQLPVYAHWQPGDYPLVGGYRLETDSSGSGLEVGDRLLRVGDRDLRGVGYVGFHAIGLARTAPGHPVPLVFERDGERGTVPLEARPHARRWSRIPILLLIPGFCALLLLRAPGQPDAQRFYLCFMTYAIGQAQFYGGPEWKSWAAAGVWSLASPLMLFFMLRWVRLFPPEMPEDRRAPAWLPVVAALTYVVVVRLNYLIGWPFPIDWVPRVSYATSGVMPFLGILVLSWNYLQARPAGRRRLRWIVLGTALGSVPVAVSGLAPLLVPSWAGFREAFALGFLSSAIWIVGAALGVVRDNAFDVDRLIGATAAWSLAAAGAVAGLAIAVPAASAWIAVVSGLAPTVVRLALAALLGALAFAAALALRPRIDRLLFPGRVRLQRGAESLVESLAHCESPDALLERGRTGVAELFEARGTALYRREPDGLRLWAAEGLAPPPRLGPDATLPVRARPRNAGRSFGADVDLVLPLRCDGRIDALIALGPKRSGDIYTTSDAEALASLGARLETEWLRFQKSAADRESAAKTGLLAAAGHDLRQPLHAVSLLADALRNKLDDPELRSIVQRIGDATQDLDEMLTGLLDRSKLDAGLVATPGPLALQEVFDAVERDFASQAESAGAVLRVVPTRLFVRSDRQLLARIVRNLVSNALRYAPGGHVLVGARRRGDEVAIEVRDDGRGIPEAEQQRIFEAFRQLPGAAHPGGLGLGLSIVDGLARVLGHRVALRSAPGRGSTFEVRVPRVAREAVPPPQAAPDGAAASVQGRRVLVVDDDPRVLDAVETALTEWGCQVRAARDAREAVAAVQGWEPQFVLCDYRLEGGTTGLQVLDALRGELGGELRAALVTGESQPGDLEAARAAGLPVLRKPVRAARLRALLAAASAGPRDRGSADAED
ncbi:MAG: hybrid sensor histidine kinase/response regulator [Myxococcota bacterium]|nr:hybrid sensor histidine kinase/response regulator [Myxococcota bacterium]